ncbi:MAG: trehalose-6-phosphate synthase [Acetobacteraceae bacterium]
MAETGRLVIVSNRVPLPRPRERPRAGGLAVALAEALASRDALWFGWSGATGGETGRLNPPVVSGRTTYLTMDLSAEDARLYYAGFANGVLWPLLHYRMGLAEFRREELEGYRRVNEAFAAALATQLRPGDTVWVHDFHLLLLGAGLRDRGVGLPVGFFLHVPFPPPGLFAALPQGEAMLRALAAYRLIGTQTAADAANLRESMRRLGLATRIEPFPIGIHPDGFAAEAARAVRGPEARRLAESLAGRALILGVDRLDYSKGLPQRLRGFAALLRRFPEHRRRVTLLQVAPVSRGEVAQYRALRRELDELAGRINGEHGDVDWVPVRWMTRTLPRATLAGFHRLAKVGLVTPIRDGMNLVAKEYVAAQDPAEPGALVLSRFAGAAAELSGAILVNPNDADEIAEGLNAALVMPAAERRVRWARDFAALRANTATDWAARFLEALGAAIAAAA